MKDKINELNRYFDENISECNHRYAELQADDRKDDAVFEKIRANGFRHIQTGLVCGNQAVCI